MGEDEEDEEEEEEMIVAGRRDKGKLEVGREGRREESG